MFAIIRYDGNYTELYTARDIAHQWVKETRIQKIWGVLSQCHIIYKMFVQIKWLCVHNCF